MIDLKIDPVTRNLVLNNGQLAITATGKQTLQECLLSLSAINREWWLNLDFGPDYINEITIKPFSKGRALREISRVLRNVVTVSRIKSLVLTPDLFEQALHIEARIITIFGTEEEVSVAIP